MTCRALELNAEIEALNAMTDRIEAGEPSAEWMAMVAKADDLWGVMRSVEPSTVDGAQIVARAFAHWLEGVGRYEDAHAVMKAAQGLQSGAWPLLRLVSDLGGGLDCGGLLRYLRLAVVVAP